MKAKIFTIKGEAKEDVNLPKEYCEKFSKSLLLQAIRVYEDGTHFGLAKVQTRSEVNRTRKKLYKQKGTGGARHGARSAPIFVGGGVAHGPKGVKRVLNLPVKMKKKALLAALSNKFESKKAVLIEGLEKISKTAEGNNMLLALRKTLEVKSRILIVLSKESMKLARFFKNIKDIEVIGFESLNAFKVMSKSLILIESNIFKTETKKETKVGKIVKKEIKK